jgi:hypothetical protein
VTAEDVVDGGLGPGLGVLPPRQPRRAGGTGEPFLEGDAELGRVGDHPDGGRVLGIDPRRRGADLHLAGARPRQPLVQHLGRRRRSDAQHQRRRVVGGEAGVAEHRVEGADRGGLGHAASRARVGQHGPARRPRQPVHGERVAGAGAGHDDAPLRLERGDEGVELRRRHERRSRRGGVPRPALGTRRRQVARLPDQRVTERQVQMYGSRLRCHGVGHGPGRDRAPCGAHALLGHARIAEPPHGPAVQVVLVDGLGRRDVAQFGRAVGGAHDQRHLGLVGLDDGAVEVSGGRPARAQQHRGPSRGETQAEGQERRRAFVVMDVHAQLGPVGEGDGERRRP